MRKKVIYVDFIFKHRRVTFLNYYILHLFSSALRFFTKFTGNKNTSMNDTEERKMFK